MSENDVTRLLIGYCAYNKSPIYDDDDYIEYKGKLFLRDNFVQASLDGLGNIVDPCEEE